MPNTNFIPFEGFIVRSPLLSFTIFSNRLSGISKSEERFKELFGMPLIQEAIFIASPVLYEKLQKYLFRGLKDIKEEERLKYSLIRYLSRMSTRCTPFGLFAACSFGHIGEQSNVLLRNSKFYSRHTRLDMNYLCALSNDIAKNSEIKFRVKYYRNNSIYLLGDRIRYVEYFYNGTKRFHRISAIGNSNYIRLILKKSKTGIKYKELVELLVNEYINVEESTSFIDELINSQILISELSPLVTGNEFLTHLINTLNCLMEDCSTTPFLSTLTSRLSLIRNLLIKMDTHPIGSQIKIYNEIISSVQELGTTFELKHLFQTDMVKPVVEAVLDKKIVNSILETTKFLHKISSVPSETNLSQFKAAFLDRYESAEMPLLQVLDNETGIGYGQNNPNNASNDINPFIDDLIVPKVGSNNSIQWNLVQSILLKKYLNIKKSNSKQCIELTDEDFKNLPIRPLNLPITFSVICRLLNLKNSTTIYYCSGGGASASNILGRFCHADRQIFTHVLEITNKEILLDPEPIYAEIVHLPEARVGNILLRPILRSYEIPYLAQSAVEDNFKIELSDLTIAIRNNKIILRSSKLKKEIIPRLSSAHNYSHGLPVYRFLCDMQSQDINIGVSFQWGTFFNEFKMLPRIYYKDVILSPAKWIIKTEEIQSFFETKDDKGLVKIINTWKKVLLIPRYVTLNDGDNELFIDMNNSLSLRTMYSLVKKRDSFNISEFLFNPKEGLVKGEDGIFTNEFIISFYKNINNEN